MNSILIYLVAVICTAQIADVRGDALNIIVLRAQLDKAKEEVNRAISDLTPSKDKLRDDLNNRLYSIESLAMESINNTVNFGMDEIRDNVNSAKEAGKNADHCLEPGRLALHDISQNASSAITTCRTNDAEAVDPLLGIRKFTIIMAADLLLEKIDKIFLDCYSSSILEMESCIAMVLGKVNILIRQLQDIVKTHVSSVTDEPFRQGSSCMLDVSSSTRPKILPVVASAKDCISKA